MLLRRSPPARLRWRSPMYAVALSAHSAAKCCPIASRTRAASPRSVSFSFPYCASVWSCEYRTPSPAGTAMTSDLSTRACRWSARSSAEMSSSAHDDLGGRQVAAAREHRQRFEHPLLVVEEAARSSSRPRLAASAAGAGRCGTRRSADGTGPATGRRSGRSGSLACERRQARWRGADRRVGHRCRGSARRRRRGAAVAPAASARARKSPTASSGAKGGTGQMVSPPTRRPSRLVARSRRCGHRCSRSSATSAAAATRCSQLSSTEQRLAITDHLGDLRRIGQIERGRDLPLGRPPGHRGAPARRGNRRRRA